MLPFGAIDRSRHGAEAVALAPLAAPQGQGPLGGEAYWHVEPQLVSCEVFGLQPLQPPPQPQLQHQPPLPPPPPHDWPRGEGRGESAQIDGESSTRFLENRQSSIPLLPPQPPPQQQQPRQTQPMPQLAGVPPSPTPSPPPLLVEAPSCRSLEPDVLPNSPPGLVDILTGPPAQALAGVCGILGVLLTKLGDRPPFQAANATRADTHR